MNLYEINEEILNCVDLETGEIVEADKLEELQIAFDVKVENVGCWIKNLLAEASALKEEKEKLAKRQSTCKNKAESLKEYLGNVLAGQKFKTSKVSISFRKTEAVSAIDITKVEDDYLKYKEPELNKTKIKEAIKAGVNVLGAELITSNNIQIK